jgi:hypothetical protein
MKKILGYLLLFIAAAFITTAGLAIADTVFLPPAETQEMQRTCNFSGVTAKTVSVTSSSAATATLARGNLRLVCTQDAHFYHGAAGVTAPTAGTASTFIAAKSPEYVYAPSGTKLAFIRDSADGTCYVTECK